MCSVRRKCVTLVLCGCIVVQSPLCATVVYGAETREELQKQLQILEDAIAKNKGALGAKKDERKQLEKDMRALEAKIKEAEQSIKKRDQAIQQLAGGIHETERGIETLDTQLSRSRRSLAQLLRVTRVQDDETLVELMLRGDTLSGVFSDRDNLISVRNSLDEQMDDVKENKQSLAQKKETLEETQAEHEQLREIQLQEKRVIQTREQEKEQLVKAVKGEEKEYERYIKEQEKSASEIRSALFALRDTTSGPVSFGQMYDYAKEAGARTGVRPVVILAILTEESNLGQNVGKGSWMTDMHPTRDRPVFAEICAALGLDPDKQPVSKKPWYGWGGAMGPGQFIPSTWKGIAPRVTKITGNSPANPWNARDATFATALYMMDAGADKQTRESERLAAQRYLAGWANANKASYQFYGREVMAIVDRYEREIKVLEGN